MEPSADRVAPLVDKLADGTDDVVDRRTERDGELALASGLHGEAGFIEHDAEFVQDLVLS